MDNASRIRTFYLARVLYEMTDEEHSLSTIQILQILEERYGIKAHRQTIKSEIELLRQCGMEIQEVKSTQNRYNICARRFDTPELKLLIDAVESSKFITAGKSRELVGKLSSLTSRHVAVSLKRNVSCEGRIKPDNERIYLIVDAINKAINENRKISFPYFRYNVKKEKELRHNGEPYIVTPLHLVWNGDCYYMLGVFASNHQLGSFRVDRIAKCPVILEEDGDAAPTGFNLDNYLNKTFRMYNSECRQVTLLCENGVMDSMIDKFGEEMPICISGGNAFTAIVDVAVSHVFFSWIFGFEGKVKIVGPADVKEQYTAMVRKAAMEL